MDFKDFIKKSVEDINSFFTFWLIKLLDCLSWSAAGGVVRANILRALGFKIEKNVKILTGITIHKRTKNLQIKKGTFINKNVYFDIGTAPIIIGQCCDIGFNTNFSNSIHRLKSDYRQKRARTESKPIIIEDFVWIGCNVTILGGVTVGKGSVIGAGSLVTKDIPPNVMAAGIPAKVIKEL